MLQHLLPDKGNVDELTQEFVAKSEEGLERMELCLTELEGRPHDCGLMPEIFRAVHTINGTTSFTGSKVRLDPERLRPAASGLFGVAGRLTGENTE